MLRLHYWLAFGYLTGSLGAAERVFDWNQYATNQVPAGFRSLVSGEGNTGDWQIIPDEAALASATSGKETNATAKSLVLAQLSRDPTDEHFPLLVFDGGNYGDFTVTTRIKMMSGAKEQMAGLAFRIQDETNYYVVRASALGNTFRFYKVVNGERGEVIGPETPIPKGTWMELTVECKGNRIRCLLDGKELIPPMTDLSFTLGKIGFWTKSDSVSYFGPTRISYSPHEPLAQILLRDQLKKYNRVRALRIYAKADAKGGPRIIASNQEKEIGDAGGYAEENVISQDVFYASHPHTTVTVTLPLHDRNGEVMGALQATLKSFPGQTESNAIERTMPIVRAIEARVRSKVDLLD
jgi:hypothetical protein